MEKLHSLGIVSCDKFKLVFNSNGVGSKENYGGMMSNTNQSFMEIAKAKVKRFREAVWVQIGAHETMDGAEQLG